MIRIEERILLYASILWTFSEGLLGPLFAVFSERIGGSILDVSWAWATFLIISGIGISIVSKFSDKYRKDIQVFLGFSILTIFSFSYLLVFESWHLLIVQAGLGIGLAFAVPNWYALYDLHSGNGEHDGFVWGLSQGSWQVTRGLAILTGGALVHYISFNALFITMGLVMLAASLYQLFFVLTISTR